MGPSPRPRLPAGGESFPRPTLPAGFELSPWPALPAGRDFGPVRTCGAFPPTAARRAPHRSRSHGRLRRPKSLPIRHSPAAVQCRPFLGWRDIPVLTFWLHRFASLGLKSRIDAHHHRAGKYNCPPSASRCCYYAASDSIFLCHKVEWFRLHQLLPLRCRVRFQFSSSHSIAVPPAEARCRSIEWPACSGRRCIDELPVFRMTVAGAGRDRLPRRRHNPK